MSRILSAPPEPSRSEYHAAGMDKHDAPQRQAWRVREFCEGLGISNSTFWKYVAAGRIRVIRVGRRVLIPITEAARIAAEGL